MEEPSNCLDCGCSARSLAAAECRASDCPLNSANRQRPLGSDCLAVPDQTRPEGTGADPYFVSL